MAKIGWAITILISLFLLVASVAPKFLGAQVAVEALVDIGWSPDYLLLIGIIELTCLVLFVIPRTALIGAILMTGLLGGAIASHLRAGSPLFTHTLFSIYLGSFLWAALWLRNENIRKYLRLQLSNKN